MMRISIRRTTLASIVLLLLLSVGCTAQGLCADEVNSDPLPPDQDILSVSCLGNGSASVSYNLLDSPYKCQEILGHKIQVDYICYSNNSHLCKNETVFELNDRCSDEAVHPTMDECDCRFEVCIEKSLGQVQMLPISGQKSCDPDGDPTETMPSLSSSFTIVESIVTNPVLALTSDVSKTTLTATYMPTSSSSLSVTSVQDNPPSILEWVVASLAVFIVLLALLVVAIIAVFTLRSATDKRNDSSEWLRSTKQMAFIGRDPSTESLRTVLDLLSLPNVAQAGATQSVAVDVHHDYGTQDFVPSEPTFKIVTDFHFSDDDSTTYIHLGVPVPLSPTTANGLTDDSILQQTHFPCQNEQPLSDCTISITSSLDDPLANSTGYESTHERQDSVLSNGYTTVSGMTTTLQPTAGGLGNDSTDTVQVHNILDLRPEVVQEPGRTDPSGPAPANDIRATVLTGDSEKEEDSTETHTSSPSPATADAQERIPDTTFSKT